MSENSLLTNLEPREPAPKNKRGGATFALLGTVWLFVSWFVVVQFVLPGIIWVLAYPLHLPVRAALEKNLILYLLFGFSYAPLTLLVAYPFYKKYLPKFNEKFWRFIGYRRALKVSDIWRAILGYVAYFILSALVLLVVQALVHGLDLNQKQVLGINTPSTGFDVLTVFIALVIIPPLVEETLFRGLLFSTLRKGYAAPISAVITSLAFGAAHLGEAAGALNVGLFLDTFSLSLVLCYLRIQTGSLWSGVFLHGLKNFVAFLYFVGYIR